MIRGEDGSMFLKVGSKGCSSSDVWDDGFGGQVTQIFIWHDKMIHGIQAVYQRHGTTVVGEMHGSDEGNFVAVCLDGPLTRVSGHYDRMIVDLVVRDLQMFGEDYGLKVINSLKFETDTSSYGPFGARIGEAFSFAAETGICGFHGRCSKHTPPKIYGDEDLVLPNGWIAAFGVYVNVTTTGIVGQASLGSSPSRTRVKQEKL